jgi:hypothetical protein
MNCINEYKKVGKHAQTQKYQAFGRVFVFGRKAQKLAYFLWFYTLFTQGFTKITY